MNALDLLSLFSGWLEEENAKISFTQNPYLKMSPRWHSQEVFWTGCTTITLCTASAFGLPPFIYGHICSPVSQPIYSKTLFKRERGCTLNAGFTNLTMTSEKHLSFLCFLICFCWVHFTCFWMNCLRNNSSCRFNASPVDRNSGVNFEYKVQNGCILNNVLQIRCIKFFWAKH